MKFGNIYIIYCFFAVIVLILFYIRSFTRKKRAIEKFTGKMIFDQLVSKVDYRRKKIKMVVIVIAVALCIVSLMRPKWGFEWEEIRRKGLDILIAVDVSNSMLAEDIKPNRFQRTKYAIKDMTKELTGDRIGLIAFSGSAFLQCPLTIDYGGFLLTLKDLEVGAIPREGTSLSSAIVEAITTFKDQQAKNKILILITDGEDHEGNAMVVAQQAKKEGITIFCIGIGTKEGELIPYTDQNGKKGFLKDLQGNVVNSKLDETTLQKIALITGGSYVKATPTEFGLDVIYKEKLSKFEKRDIESKMKKNYMERFQIPLALAFILLLFEPLIGDKKVYWFER